MISCTVSTIVRMRTVQHWLLPAPPPNSAMEIQYRKLGDTDMRLSIISLGGTGYGGLYGEYDEEEAAVTLRLVL